MDTDIFKPIWFGFSPHSSLTTVIRLCRYATLNLLYPPHCTFCEEAVSSEPDEPLICTACRIALTPTLGSLCRRCGMSVSDVDAQYDDCPRCRNVSFQFDSVTPLGIYHGELRDAVLRMKQSQHEPLTMVVGTLLANRIVKSQSAKFADLILPVPMHWTRRMSRGVNQAELLVSSISQRLGLPVLEDFLRCRRKTKKQGTLGPRERQENVRGAFGVSADYDIAGANVLVVDDVMTTGATANEVAKVCRKAGAASVSVAVVARAVGLL